MRQPLRAQSHLTIPLANSLLSAGPTSEIGDDFRLLDINFLVTSGREGFFAFEVTGDSMVDTIKPGALVFVDTWAEPRNGSIIAADVNGLTCIKIFQYSSSGLYLVSANIEYKPKEITSGDSFRVLGVVTYQLSDVRR